MQFSLFVITPSPHTRLRDIVNLQCLQVCPSVCSSVRLFGLVSSKLLDEQWMKLHTCVSYDSNDQCTVS